MWGEKESMEKGLLSEQSRETGPGRQGSSNLTNLEVMIAGG